MSDQTTPLSILRQEVRQFITDRDWAQFHSPKDLAIGLIIEASELLELFRFRNEAEIEALLNEPTFRENLSHELADCLYFILAISHNLDIDMTVALRQKIAISAERYPVEIAKGRNDKYTAYEG